ncbi:dynein regulatory complex subunit 5 isoform X1 [Neodiprion pinetum]|uniref:Dynein regulatory complex subunit 5-like isoform X1 n=2 Tax=Neodiprion lecontei TaxID=441921 RepID=A0ABM3GIU7_NEOLC|nr:dynein regulatory complex subunit 5-like isoform X1 [Neodiprion pinetum]XP_046489444.1 dynein regulatory complex subunit 5-like isoform X1 [Neodiprion pinetum]XP_046600181.1 dynein regulatory complex subunit 5-like isoform X1 [Neodiprion lecontei]XP_046600182.1 dynein regulatory complex subunit 5-like isoform X1 [Neodiprion lecontei]
MRIPYTISRNVFETYRCSQQTIQLPNEQERTLRPEDENWDANIVPELKVLAMHVLVEHWQDNPILDELPTPVDRDLLLELLPTNLPFELTIKWIPDEVFWKRAASDRWEHNYPDDHGGSWRRLYVERHFSEYLESLPATFFKGQQESCNEFIELCKEYVFMLKIRSLVPSSSPADKADECISEEEDSPNHIPFNEIITRLPNLTEMSINFGLIYMNDGFDWRDFKFSVEDCKNLGSGIKNSVRLAKFSLTRSNLDSHRVAALLHGMAVNNTVVEMNLSHCKLGDLGAQAVGEYLTINKRLRIIHLANNYIGARGAQGIVHGLLQESSAPLKELNLRLNPLTDVGGNHICALILRHQTLESLNISGCSLTTEGGINMAECLASGYVKSPTLELDLSNNELGPIAGEAFEVAVTSCNLIVGLDVRMCNFSKKSEYTISESVARNKKFHRQNRPRQMSSRMSSSSTYPRGVSLAVPPAYTSMQISPAAKIPAGFQDNLRTRSRMMTGSRSAVDDSNAQRLSRNDSASRSKVGSSSMTLSATNEETLSTEPVSANEAPEPRYQLQTHNRFSRRESVLNLQDL